MANYMLNFSKTFENSVFSQISSNNVLNFVFQMFQTINVFVLMLPLKEMESFFL